MRHGQQHGHGVFGDADGVSAGRIHDQHALARGGVQVDVVHAHAGAADHAQILRFFQQLGGHFRRAANQQRVRVANFLRDLAFRLGKIHHLPGRIRLQNCNDVFGNAVRHQNFHFVFIRPE